MPMYYYRDHNGIPGAWIENMKNAREMILHDYTATRMIRQYIEEMYLPSIETITK
jgi:glucan phosphorylase